VSSLIVITGIIGLLLLRHIRRRIKVEEELRVAQQQLLCSNEQLELLAMRDALTGLANRRCFDKTLAIEARRAKREGVPLALLMIDIDYFKLFNDSLGHVAGDTCLQEVGKILEDCVRRPSDLVARYGGEEMGIIMPNTNSEGAAVVAQTILDRIKQRNIPHKSSPLGLLSVSIGIATASGSELEQTQWLIKSADQALYRAKEAGRGQAVCYS
jgi:diguanylate cyclase (GGDEF)-like protein